MICVCASNIRTQCVKQREASGEDQTLHVLIFITTIWFKPQQGFGTHHGTSTSTGESCERKKLEMSLLYLHMLIIGMISTPSPTTSTTSVPTTITASTPKSAASTSTSTTRIMLLVESSNIYSFGVHLQRAAKKFWSIKLARVLNCFIGLLGYKKRELWVRVKKTLHQKDSPQLRPVLNIIHCRQPTDQYRPDSRSWIWCFILAYREFEICEAYGV